MTKTEYMKILARSLRRLPKEDYDRAIEYFEEYFAEAGPENEQQAVSDLGSPEEAAKELIMDLAAQNIKEKPKTVKRGLSTLWIAVLALCVVVGTFGAYALYLQGVKDAGSMRASLLGTIEPVTATIATVVWLATPFSAAEIVGFALIIVMVYLTA